MPSVSSTAAELLGESLPWLPGGVLDPDDSELVLAFLDGASEDFSAVESACLVRGFFPDPRPDMMIQMVDLMVGVR